ncbi:hypothetical protein [Thalassotalea sp. PLHSN55]|uniref:hypothetical protein n=1 Tax=Thalassotalea sp. PLHSN55 TaxID=3435888 RepID=UPI003F84D7CC
MLRDLGIKVQTRKKQLADIDKAHDLFEAILNDLNVEGELLKFLEQYLGKQKVSEVKS